MGDDRRGDGVVLGRGGAGGDVDSSIVGNEFRRGDGVVIVWGLKKAIEVEAVLSVVVCGDVL